MRTAAPKSIAPFLLVAGLCCLPGVSHASMNGKHVTTVGGNMQLSTILNSEVSGSPFVSTDQVESPQFSFDGTKIACWRNSGSAWYLSVMNVGDHTFTNLLDAAIWTSTAPKVPAGGIRWPAGDWIYFARPDNTNLECGELWRINSTDPSRKEMVIDYIKPTDQSPRRMLNFYLSPDIRIGMVGLANTSGQWTSFQPIHRFPPVGDNPFAADNLLLDLPNCNPCVSPTGAFAGRFLNGGHESIFMYQWDDGTQSYVDGTGFFNTNNCPQSCITNLNLEGWSGQADWVNILEGPDWAVNSDRWMTMAATTPDGEGSNSMVFSWVDQKTIKMTNNSNAHSEGGCLYVEGAAGSVQRLNGTWSALTPVVLLPRIDVAGYHSPYQVTLSSKPVGAEFYYTTDGTEPTQLSTHYTGSFSLSVPATSRTTLKVRAYLAGQGSSNVVQKLLFADMTKSVGLTCELWTGITGGAITDLMSHQGYPDSPDRTWLAYEVTNQYGSPWTQVQQGKDFGYRVRGYVVPQITGPYVFDVTSNSAVSLKLGTSSLVASVVEIANIVNKNDIWSPTKITCNPITLQAGVWYYIEALCKGDATGYTQIHTSYSSSTGGDLALMPIDSIPRDPVRSIRLNGAMARGTAASTNTAKAAVYNALGNRVLETRGISQACLPAGIYFVKIGNGRSGEVRRMVVNRFQSR